MPLATEHVTLGVKGRLTKQELEQLRGQLAQAAAYAHVPDQQRAARVAASKPMTKIYRRLESQEERSNQARSYRKTLASIQYEHKFSAKAYDSLKPRPTRGIDTEAKRILQDEYLVKSREVGCVSQCLSLTNPNEGSGIKHQSTSGKRRGLPAVPQVFIM